MTHKLSDQIRSDDMIRDHFPPFIELFVKESVLQEMIPDARDIVAVLCCPSTHSHILFHLP